MSSYSLKASENNTLVDHSGKNPKNAIGELTIHVNIKLYNEYRTCLVVEELYHPLIFVKYWIP